MAESEKHWQTLIKNYTRRLQKLREQQALQGQSVEPRILLEIEDIEAELERLQAELAAAEVTGSEATPASRTVYPPPQEKSMPDEKEPREGGIRFGDHARVQGDVFTGGKRVVNTGGGAYIEGNVNTGGGDFVGRDRVKSSGLSAADVARLFEPIYTQINARPGTSPEDKADLKTDLQELQAEVVKGERADESFLSRRLRNIKRMAPDILEVVTATFTNPLAGFSAVVARVAQKMQESADDR